MAQDKVRVVNTEPTRPQPQRVTLVTFLALLAIALSITLQMVWPYLLAVVMGGILALLGHSVYEKLRRRNFKTKSAALLVTLGIVLLVIVPLSLFTVMAVKQGISVGQRVAQSDAFSFQSILERVGRLAPIESVIGSPEALERQARTWIQSAGARATALILAVAGNVPNILLQLALASIACFFFLIDGRRFMTWMRGKIPLDSDVREKVVASFKDTAISVIWATLAAAGAQSTMMLISFLVLGIPAAFLAAGATFIFAWIPILGSVPVWVTGAIYLYTQGAVAKAIILVALGFLTGVVDNFVRPLVLKGRGNMHPLVSLVAIFGGVGMFGIMGVFIGPIIAAILISLLQIWPAVGQRFGLRLNH